MITTTVDGPIGLLTLDRTERRNALDTEHCRDLEAAVTGLGTEEGVRAVVITGAGTAFCSGADLDQVASEGFLDALYSMLRAVVATPRPVLAAVNGPAIGAGTQLAIACDFRVAGPGASFALPTAQLGLAVDPWTIRRLAMVAGHRTARALLLACQTLDAEQAAVNGLADLLGTTEDALAWAGQIATFAPLSIAYNKRVLDAGLDRRPDQAALDAELTDAFAAIWTSADSAEGPRARVERRAPDFRGH